MASTKKHKSKRSTSISKQKRKVDDDDNAYDPTLDHEPTSMSQKANFRKRKFDEVVTK